MTTSAKFGIPSWLVVGLLTAGCTLLGVEPDEIDLADESETGALTGSTNGSGDGDGDAEGANDDETGEMDPDDGQGGDGDGDATDTEDMGDGDPGDGDPGDGDSGDGDGDPGTECAMFDPMPLEVGEHAIDIPDVPSQFEGNCGGAGPDALFSFMAPADGTYEFTLTSVAFEGVLYLVGDECIPLDWIACVPEGEEPLVHQMVQGEVVYIIVDSTADPGPATLTIAAI
jgi:hypothetical protein